MHVPCRHDRSPLHPDGAEVNKVFFTGRWTPHPGNQHQKKLEHRVQELARTFNIVPALANQSLLSGGKFAEAGYVSVCNGDEVKIYDGWTETITVSEDAVLKGWRCPRTELWQIPL